jgi:[ribosomal protein S5]-alanine N-acetyltransferase
MLTEHNITLRKLTIKDKDSMALLANNKKVWDNLRDYFPFPYTENHAAYFINLVKDDAPITTFAIDCKDQFCGVISLVKQQDVYRLSAEIGYWIGEPFWNKGIATKAVRLITRYGFNDLQLIRIFTGVFEYNTGSMRVLEKCGYTKDCIFEKAIIKNGQLWNEHRYSIIATHPSL